MAKRSVHIAVQSTASRTNPLFILNAQSQGPKVIWRFSDGRAGHDAQSIGLTDALSNLVDCKVYDVTVPFPFNAYAWSILKRLPPCTHLPAPTLLIGAGHACHVPILAAGFVHNCQTLILMSPSLPASLFDFCLVPEHDKRASAKTTILTTGPLNNQSVSKKLASDRGLIMIGGPSRHFDWDEQRLREQIHHILRQDYIKWTITSSPRTPASTHELLMELNHSHVNYLPYKNSGAADINELLEVSATIWSTEDSMSMMYEALSTGAAVGILDVPEMPNNKLSGIASDLANNSFLTLFDQWLSGKTLSPPARPLSESARCAKIVADQLGWWTGSLA